jgi:hypothetical protein
MFTPGPSSPLGANRCLKNRPRPFHSTDGHFLSDIFSCVFQFHKFVNFFFQIYDSSLEMKVSLFSGEFVRRERGRCQFVQKRSQTSDETQR